MTNLEIWTMARAANWEKFESFTGLSHGEATDEALANPGEWTLYHLDHRDSDLLSQSNAEVLRERLNALKNGDVHYTRLGHWACGYVHAAMVRVLRDGKPTFHAEVLYQAERDLEDYPVLDDEHFSNLEEESYTADLREKLRYEFKVDDPDDAIEKVREWLYINEPNAFGYDESGEVHTPFIEQAVLALGLSPEEDF